MEIKVLLREFLQRNLGKKNIWALYEQLSDLIGEYSCHLLIIGFFKVH